VVLAAVLGLSQGLRWTWRACNPGAGCLVVVESAASCLAVAVTACALAEGSCWAAWGGGRTRSRQAWCGVVLGKGGLVP
jgi:hypothetical protein